MPESRAIVFDLDDTLYPYRAFVRSGFRAVSRTLAEDCGLPRLDLLRALRRALAGEDRGRELQALCTQFDLPTSLMPSLIAIMREHAPTLRLPCESRRVLSALRTGWKVGILTNGIPRIQRRKATALGVFGLVDHVAFAAECADGGKPSPAAFHHVLDRLGTPPERAVFVGDDWQADIAGASAIGMKTIHVTDQPTRASCGNARCGAHVSRLDQVPRLADALVPEGN